MQVFKRILALGLCGIAAIAFAACGNHGTSADWGNYDSVSDGGAWNDTEDENVKEITVSKTIGLRSIMHARQIRPSIKELKKNLAAMSWR